MHQFIGAPTAYISTSGLMKSEPVLVLIAATEDGSKELLAVVDGYRESSRQCAARCAGASRAAPQRGDGQMASQVC
jgi:hypothetical protein